MTSTHSSSLALLPPTSKIWGKVICLHLSVILFTGGYLVLGELPGPRGVSGPQGYLVLVLGGVWSQGCLVPEGVWSQGVPPLGKCLVPGGAWSQGCPQMATAAGSTHPTGMHSCFLLTLPDAD